MQLAKRWLKPYAMANSRIEVEIPDIDSTKSYEKLFFGDDDEIEDDMMKYSPALVADTTAIPRMETVATSMKTLSVELDQRDMVIRKANNELFKQHEYIRCQDALDDSLTMDDDDDSEYSFSGSSDDSN
ncbi:hypothetical protein LEN26_000181 [Aphanomyces euteiches]|nr:hypothetical protein LEN26_000181 [Aphanomyces euteiches]